MRSRLVLLASVAGLLLPVAHAGAANLKSELSGDATASGKVDRTITDISPPGSIPSGVQAVYTVSLTVPNGTSAAAAATMLRDSIIAQVGGSGFTATLLSPTQVEMSRVTPFTSDDKGKIQGLKIVSGDMLVMDQHKGHTSGASLVGRQPAEGPPSLRAEPLRSEGTAGLPSAAFCSVDAHFVVCPAADLTPFQVTLRDGNNVPCSTAYVYLGFCAEPLVKVLTDGFGLASFTLGRGGLCPSVTISSDLGELATRPVASPDQDGDLLVDVDDEIILAAKVGTTDPTGDLDGDGVVSGSSIVTGVGSGPSPGRSRLSMVGPWPNVLRPGGAAFVTFHMTRRAEMFLELFDLTGRRASTLSLGPRDSGWHRVEWRVPAGVRPGFYTLRLRDGLGEGDANGLIVR